MLLSMVARYSLGNSFGYTAFGQASLPRHQIDRPRDYCRMNVLEDKHLHISDHLSDTVVSECPNSVLNTMITLHSKRANIDGGEAQNTCQHPILEV